MINKSITTAEQATATRATHGKGYTNVQMLCAITDIRNDEPSLAHYLSNPEIIIGLSSGRFGINGLKRRLNELAAIDA